MKKYLILITLLVGCSPAWHLKKAKEHLKKAEIKGAAITADTVFQTKTFKVEGASATFNLGPSILHRKDGVTNKYILKDTVIYKDRIKTVIKDNVITIDCPDEEIKEEIPVAINTEIKAGYTKWQYGTAIVGGIILGLVIGFILGKVIKVTPF